MIADPSPLLRDGEILAGMTEASLLFPDNCNAVSFALNKDVGLFDPLLGIIQIILFSSLKCTRRA
jgi:hypothetical protein